MNMVQRVSPRFFARKGYNPPRRSLDARRAQWIARAVNWSSVVQMARNCAVEKLAARFPAAVLSILLFISAASEAHSERLALVIGNGAYTAIPALPNPTNDANDVSALLSGLGFEVTTVTDAGLATMVASLDEFATRAQDAEIALVFFAGHGVQVQGTNFLVPVDINVSSLDGFRNSALPLNDVFNFLNRAAPATSIVILDACRDNPFAGVEGVSQGFSSGNASSAVTSNRPNSAGTIIAFSAAPGAVALDGQDGNSPYTAALLQWMPRPGMELSTMLRRVRRTVLDLTNGAQVPWVEEALVRDVILNPAPPEPARPDSERAEFALLASIDAFANPDERDAARVFYDRYVAIGTSELAPSPAMDDRRLVEASLIWLSIRESTDKAVFQAYVEEFPDLEFTELARARIDELPDEEPEIVVATWLGAAPEVPVGGLFGSSAAPDTSATAVGALSAPQVTDDASPSAGRPGASATPGNTPSMAVPQLETAPSIDAAAVPPSPSSIESDLGLSPAELLAVQRLLAQLGYYGGAIDGDFGPGTRGAIARLQAANGLTETGFLTVGTLQQLVGRAAPGVLAPEGEEPWHSDVHRLGAIATRGPGAEPQVIRVEAMSRNDRVHAVWFDVADRFEAENPGTLIEINHRPDRRYRVELMALLGSEDPPDILHTWSGGHLEALREAGFARDLTPIMADGWAFEFKPGALQTYTTDGRIYGVPQHLSLISLYANRSVFDAAGIDPARLETWDGFIDVVREFREAGITPIAAGGADVWTIRPFFSQLAQRLGGPAVIDAAVSGVDATFSSPAFQLAAEEFGRFAELMPFHPDFHEINDNEATRRFIRGEAAMMLAGNWRLGLMEMFWPGGLERMEEELLQLEFPTVGPAPQEDVTYGGADGFAVSPDAPDIAIDFLRRLVSIEVQERVSQVATAIPSLSGADLGLEDQFLRSASERVLNSTYHQLFLDQALTPEVGNVLNEELLRVATGEISAAEALNAIGTTRLELLAPQ